MLEWWMLPAFISAFTWARFLRTLLLMPEPVAIWDEIDASAAQFFQFVFFVVVSCLAWLVYFFLKG